LYSTPDFDDLLAPLIKNFDKKGKKFEYFMSDLLDRLIDPRNIKKIRTLYNRFPNRFKSYKRLGSAVNPDLILYDLTKLLQIIFSSNPEVVETKGFHPKSTSKVTPDKVAAAQDKTKKHQKSITLFATTTMNISPSVYSAAVSYWITDNEKDKTVFLDAEALRTIIWALS
jgi:hypothetical protein